MKNEKTIEEKIPAITPELVADLSKLGAVYADPRQLIYTKFTDYMLQIQSDVDRKKKDDEKWFASRISAKEQKIICIIKFPAYRLSNNRGRALVFRCERNEEIYDWNELKAI